MGKVYLYKYMTWQIQWLCLAWFWLYCDVWRLVVVAAIAFKPHSARTGRTVSSQLTGAVVRHEANDGVVYAIPAWFKYSTALSAVV